MFFFTRLLRLLVLCLSMVAVASRVAAAQSGAVGRHPARQRPGPRDRVRRWRLRRPRRGVARSPRHRPGRRLSLPPDARRQPRRRATERRPGGEPPLQFALQPLARRGRHAGGRPRGTSLAGRSLATRRPRAPDGSRRGGFHENQARISFFRPLDKTVFSRRPGRLVLVVLLPPEHPRRPHGSQCRLAGGQPEEIRLRVRPTRRRLAGRGPGQRREPRLVRDRQAEVPPRHEMVGRLHPRQGPEAGHLADPQTTSDEKLFRQRPELFIRRPDGTSVFETRDPKTGKVEIDWTGRYAIDPTIPRGENGSPTCST